MFGDRRTRLSRPISRFLCVLALSVSTLIVILPARSSDAAEIAPLERALQNYEHQLEPLLKARSRLADAQSELDAENRAQDSLASDLERAEERLSDDRERFSGLVVFAYMDRGAKGSGAEAGSDHAIALSSSLLRSDEKAVRAAETAVRKSQDRLTDKSKSVSTALHAVEELRKPASEALSELDTLLHPVAPTLTGAAYRAYRRAAEEAHGNDPTCDVPAALLVGMSRVVSNHGRSKSSIIHPEGANDVVLTGLVSTPTSDTDNGRIDGSSTDDQRVGPLQLTPALWDEFTDENADPQDSPLWFYSSAVVASRALCATGNSLVTDDGLHKAVTKLTGNSAMTEAILGSARQIARTTDIGLGSLPADPRVQTALDSYASHHALEPSQTADVDALLAWSRLRIGTPYSQCLGVDARPEDPVCPPGTNRFGDGFFDCSGFVSAAYASIGIPLPSTTDAMLMDSNFQTMKIADDYSEVTDRPGDVLLMDGHVAISVGNGSILHASGGQLTEEQLPAWVRNGILGIFRPLGVE